MKLYIKKGVICWNPKGWPPKPYMAYTGTGGYTPDGNTYAYSYSMATQLYEQALSRAKAESVPVRDQKSVHEAMAKHFLNGRKINHNALIWTEGAFYTVPDSEINKEWL